MVCRRFQSSLGTQNSFLRSQIVLMIRHLWCQSNWPQSIPRPPPMIPTRTPVAASHASPIRPEWLSPSSHSLASRARSTRKHQLQARVRARAVLTVSPFQTRAPRAPCRPPRRSATRTSARRRARAPARRTRCISTPSNSSSSRSSI